MKRFVFVFLITCLVLQLLVLPVSAQPVTADDARSVAQNWVALKIRQQGNWGGSSTAQTGEIREFRQGDRLVGYFCPVSPQGFIVISLRRELAPVKAYSDTSNLDPESAEGMPGLIKEQMAAILDAIEKDAGPVESVSSSALTPLMEFNYLGAWDALDTGAPASDSQIQGIMAASNYQQGGILLPTRWHQGDPYYNEIIAPPAGVNCGEPHCLVGCAATAASQIMKYWAWPPTGVGTPYSDTYDWPRMANQYLYDTGQARWEDENGNPLTQANIDAVAELGHEVGLAEGTDYCGVETKDCQSWVYVGGYEDVFKNNFRYSANSNVVWRKDFTPVGWFTMLKDQFNRNWPVLYRVIGHAVVCDGWSESMQGGNLVRQYHMNYGGGVAANGWYTLDALPNGGRDIEYIIKDVYPDPALGWWVSGIYPALAYPYRYFDADAWGDSATFSAGQNLQFLPGITATCNSGTGSSIRFDGTSSANTRLFTHGDTSKGVIIRSGTLKLKPGGSVRLL